MLSDEKQLDSRAGRLVEQALAIDPTNGKALFFGGAAAIRRGDLPAARDRFTQLLALNPPANVKTLLEQQIAAINQQLGAAGKGSPGLAAAQGAGPDAGAPASRTQGTGQAAANTASVRVKVTLSPSVSNAAAADAPLFVFVRDPSRPGPPLAVKRLESHFPQTVELTTSDSMVPGRVIVAGQKVQVVARIARSGNPLAGSGDPVGEVPYQIGRDGLVNVVIDRLTP